MSYVEKRVSMKIHEKGRDGDSGEYYSGLVWLILQPIFSDEIYKVKYSCRKSLDRENDSCRSCLL